MARYVVVPSLTPRGIPQYYVVDTSNHHRVRSYDCGAWAEREAKRLNHPEEPDASFDGWCKILAKIACACSGGHTRKKRRWTRRNG